MFSFYLASILALSQLACAGFGASSQSNIAVYWGQNSYGQATSQQRLSTYCSNTKFNIIPLAFLTGISTPTTNFANAGNNCTVYSGTNLWDCPQLEEDIKTCQNTYSKTILLSLGGSTYAEGGFDSSATAKTNATNIWNLFGPNTTFANRPFGTAVVDGFDFDFEATTKNTAPFAQQLRDLMTSATGKTYYLAAAPQCPYPDTATNDILTNVSLDFVMVQFYNNYCGASSYTQGTTTQANFNFKTWDTWAKGSKNANVKVFLGVPASSGAAGSGYVNATGLASVINYCKTFTSFGGVMIHLNYVDSLNYIDHVDKQDKHLYYVNYLDHINKQDKHFNYLPEDKHDVFTNSIIHDNNNFIYQAIHYQYFVENFDDHYFLENFNDLVQSHYDYSSSMIIPM
ncbi:putative chitinase [Seiridium cardinale]